MNGEFNIYLITYQVLDELLDLCPTCTVCVAGYHSILGIKSFVHRPISMVSINLV